MNNITSRKRMLTVSKPADINPTVAHIRSFSFTASPDSNAVEHIFGLYIEDIPSLCKPFSNYAKRQMSARTMCSLDHVYCASAAYSQLFLKLSAVLRKRAPGSHDGKYLTKIPDQMGVLYEESDKHWGITSTSQLPGIPAVMPLAMF